MIEARYDLAGPILILSGDEPLLLDRLHAMLASLGTPVSGPPAFRIDVRRGDALPAGDGDLVFEGEVPEDGQCVMHRTGETLRLVFPRSQSLTLYPSERRAEILLAAEAGTPNWSVWMMALDAAIDAADQSLLHAAGLSLPDRDDAILIHAPSGTGKTTAALALASAGFGLLADDGVVAGLRGGSWTGWGFPRGVKIHRRTAAMLPLFAAALGPQWDANGEQAVPLGRLGGMIRVEPPTPRKLVGIFQLERAANGISSVAPTSRTEAMASLAADNVRTGRTGLLPAQKRRMDALVGLVTSVPLFRLLSGGDLDRLGPLVLSALRDQGPSK